MAKDKEREIMRKKLLLLTHDIELINRNIEITMKLSTIKRNYMTT